MKQFSLLGILICLYSTVISQPLIQSFSPVSGPVGSSVTLSGLNFSATPGDDIVFFGGVRANVTSASTTALTVTVPVGTNYSPVSVTVNNRTSYSATPFNIRFTGSPADLQNGSFFLNQKGDTTLNGAFASNQFCHDLDGDGKMDLISIISYSNGSTNPLPGSYPGAILLARNTSSVGVASFKDQQILTTGLQPSDIAFADLDGDGRAEIITANQSDNTISIFRNTSSAGKILFEAKRDFTLSSMNPNTSGYKNSVATGDLNNDGKPDIVATVGNNLYFSVFLNTSDTGTISLGNRQDVDKNITSLNSPTGIVITDLNSDGKNDIAFCNAGNNLITVYKNTTVNGIFSVGNKQDISSISFGYRIVSADLDGDGKPEIITSNNLNPVIRIFPNSSSADSIYFKSPVDIDPGTPSSYLMVNNFDGDGKPDIAVGILNTDTLVLLQNTASAGNIAFTKYKYKLNTPSNGFISQTSSADFDGDGLQDIGRNDGYNGYFFLNKLPTTPLIKSFSPQSGGTGTTVTIKGARFSGATSVRFGNDTASFFTVPSDTLITATIGLGSSGYVKITTPKGTDSLAGFTFLNPEVNITDSTKKAFSFTLLKGVYSSVKWFPINGKRLQSAIKITAPPYFQVSRFADSGFTSMITINPVNYAVDSAMIYVRCKTDSTAISGGNILIEASNAVTRTVAVSGIVCDSVILYTPQINGIAKDSLVCFKDSILLSTNGTYTIYRWSSGDSTQSVVLKNSVSNLSVQVGSKPGCISQPSALVNLVRNTNPVPILALSGSNTLVSSAAPNYRWYFNSNIIPGQNGSTLVAQKIGFYAVETSNDKICWDLSNDLPIVTLSTPLVNDSLQVKTYPNPATNGTFTVVATLQKATNVTARVTVTDAAGVVLLQTNKFIFFGREIKIPITLSLKGTVFAKVEINGDIKTQTVILQ